jgi:hypothetical protein
MSGPKAGTAAVAGVGATAGLAGVAAVALIGYGVYKGHASSIGRR